MRPSMNFLARHRFFSAAFIAGLALRVVTMLGFPPAIWYGGDSISYLSTALHLYPGTSRQSGYGVMLYLLRPFHSFAVVTGVQHLMGLAIGVMIYALLRRYRLPGWGATLAALPVLLDVYQIQLEQEMLASVAFGFLVMASLTLILWWRDKPPIWASGAAAVLLGIGATMWPVGLPLLILYLAYLLIRKAGWQAFTGALVAGVLPLALYASWFDARYHRVAFNYSDGIFLWSRTMTFADCAVIKPPAYDDALCPRQPVADRPSASTFIWETNSPLNGLPGPKFSPRNNALALHFAIRAIAAQPGDYIKDVLDDFALSFTWNRPPHPSELLAERSQFAFATNDWELAGRQARGLSRGAARLHRRQPRDYQGSRAVCLVHARIPAGVLHPRHDARGAAADRPGGHRPFVGRRRIPAAAGLGGPGLFPWVTAVTMLLLPNVTADFSERYAVPAMPVVCLAAAFAFVSLKRGAAAPLAADGRPATTGLTSRRRTARSPAAPAPMRNPTTPPPRSRRSQCRPVRGLAGELNGARTSQRPDRQTERHPRARLDRAFSDGTAARRRRSRAGTRAWILAPPGHGSTGPRAIAAKRLGCGCSGKLSPAAGARRRTASRPRG